MRLLTYTSEGEHKPGVLLESQVFDLTSLMSGNGTAAPSTIRQLLETYGSELPELAQRLTSAAESNSDARAGNISELTLAPPVPDPAKVLCIGLNYKPHVTETKRELPTSPDVFSKFASSLAGPTEDLEISTVSDKLDYEGELAIVIGTRCRNVAPEQALSNVAGATILNDTTARDLQFNGTQWLPGKAVDRSTPCGPALVTLDELGDPQDLELTTRVNGEQVQHSRTDRLIFPIPEIVSYISRFLELSPGDVISTGTPEGIGSRREPPRFLSPGDVVEIKIDKLGALENTIR